MKRSAVRGLGVLGLVWIACAAGPATTKTTSPNSNPKPNPIANPTPISTPIANPTPTPTPKPIAKPIPNRIPSPASATSAAPLRWLKGSTHVHAKPSGDSTTPIPDVIAWYEAHGYDFIFLTDHNQVSELPGGASTFGDVAVSAPAQGLLVLSGIELTHNPATCIPPPPLPDGKCRVHVNVLGVTARPEGKLEWADRKSFRRIDLYGRALVTAKELGGVAQLNHPQWHWGMSAELLTELGRRGALLVEIANSQFTTWNDGSVGAPQPIAPSPPATSTGAPAPAVKSAAAAPPTPSPHSFPSIEKLWDAALAAGVTMWGVGSDDAHSYDGKGQYPAGGAWIMVHAPREPRALLAAITAGAFYASNGVVLERAGREGDSLVVEISPQSPGGHRIAFIENGVRVEEVLAAKARRKLPARGTVRAVVTRDDGARAWVQPARRAP